LGAPVTIGLSAKRASAAASGTTITSSSRMACPQKEIEREVCEVVSPTLDLNHWRSASTSEIRAIGAWQMCDASSVRSSNFCSGSVSRIS
jgi:hypothetical protein